MKSEVSYPVAGSLRRRLLSRLVPALVVIFCGGLSAEYVIASRTSDAAFDHATGDDVSALASRVVIAPDGSVSLDLPNAATAILRTDADDLEFFSAFTPDGRLLAGDADLVPDDVPVGRPVLSIRDFRGQRIHVASYRLDAPSGPVRVAFGETSHKREKARLDILMVAILPNALLLAVTLILASQGVRYGLAPLDALGVEIGARKSGDPAPLAIDAVPLEAQPLVRAINRLLEDLAASSAAQRAFIADASHQLRTPLAGLSAQIELLLRDLPEPARDRAAHIGEAIRRLTHLTHQLLTLARSGPDANLGRPQDVVDLAEVVETLASEWFDRASSKRIEIDFDAEPAPVLGHRWLLYELATNLLDNAVRYTPEGGHILVRTSQVGGRACLEVSDDGPGIPPAERDAVFDRFYRGRAVSEGGTGLGLAIVHEIASLHHAEVAIEDADGGGARFRVFFASDASQRPS